jgi:Tol biopolymer transport system component
MSIKLLKSIFQGIRPSVKVKSAFFLGFALALSGLPVAAQPFAVSIQVEQGTYVAGDPVPMTVTVTNVTPSTTCNPVTVDVHLTPDNNVRTANDHVLSNLSGPILAPGQSFIWRWTQRMPGHLAGTFFVQAEAYTDPGPESSCGGNVVSSFGLQDAKITLIAQNHPETSLVSVSETGALGNALSETPSISQDGRWVAFASVASSLLGGTTQGEGDTAVFLPNIRNGLSDIFLRDQWTGELERITWPVSGNDPDGPSLLPRLSADDEARWIVYHSRATNLVPEQVTNGHFDVYLYDRLTSATILVSRGVDGLVGNGVSQDASVSADGRWVAFESEATNLVPNDNNNLFDIFVADVTTGAMRRVNVTNTGGQAVGGESRRPRISADGRHIVFESRATNLHSGGTPGLWEVYVHDRDANDNGIFDEPGGIATIRLSVDYDQIGRPIYSDGHSFEASLSPNGRFVTFASGATTLFSEPATGSILITGKSAQAIVTFAQNEGAEGTIGFQPDVNATGTIEFSGNANPSPGDFLQISDGVNTRTFEFAEIGFTVGADRIRVILGANAGATRTTLAGAINRAFLIDGEQTLEAVSDLVNGNPGLRLTNLVQGELGNDQPISEANAPSLLVTGMGGAAVNQPAPGDELVIDNNRTGPVTVRFFAAGEADPTDFEARVLGVVLGPTAKKTSLNLLEVFHGLGYVAYDLPQIPAQMLSPLFENPNDGDFFLFSREVEGLDGEIEVFEVAFRFVSVGPQFNPNVPEQVLIGETAAETRGNLLRAIGLLFDFAPLPAVIEASGEPFVPGQSFADTAAQGSIEILQVPEDGFTIEIGDGIRTATFRFLDERDQTDQEEEADLPVPPFELLPQGGPFGQVVAVYLVDNIPLGQVRTRLANAINFSFLDITANQAGPVIELIHGRVGVIGNVAMTKAPVRTEEEIEAGDAPWVILDGLGGGGSVEIEDGARLVFYPENLLHPSIIFEFRQDLADLSQSAHFGVQLGATASETEGNLLAALYQSGLPRVIASSPDPDLPNVVLESQIGAAGGVIVYEFSPSNPAQFSDLSSTTGSILPPPQGGIITVSDREGNSVVFEFTSDGFVSNGNIPVSISPVVAANRDNFIRAVNEVEELGVVAVDDSFNGEIRVRLLRVVPGPIFGSDLAVGKDLGDRVLVASMDGTANPSEGEAFEVRDGVIPAVTFEFVLPGNPVSVPDRSPIEIGFDANDQESPQLTRDNIIDAFKEAGLNIGAVPFTENGQVGVRLTHFSTGPVGNFLINILTPLPSFAVNGMAGGGSLSTGIEQVYLVDRDANDNGRFDQTGQVTLELISKSPLGTGGNEISREPTVTADGRFVAFRSQANNLLPLTVTRSDGEVFTNIVDSVDLVGFDAEGGLRRIGVDFSSEIARLADVDNFPDIYLFDRQTGEHRRVDVNRFGESMLASSNSADVGGAPRSSRKPAVNADGRFIVFESDDEPFIRSDARLRGDQQIREGGLAHGATNRFALDGPNNARDIYIHDQRFLSSGIQFEGLVELEAPVSPLSVGAAVPLRATVSELEAGRTVSSVRFYANGILVATATAPIVPNGIVDATSRLFDFSGIWTPTVARDYILTAEATDSRGRILPLSNVRQATVSATVGNPLTLTIVSPTPTFGEGEGAVFNPVTTNRSNLPLIAQANAGGSPVVRVAFFIRGQYVGDASREQESRQWRLDFSFADFLNVGPAASGGYDLRALAWDASGNIVSAGPVTILVQEPVVKEPPTIDLLVASPAMVVGQTQGFQASVSAAVNTVVVDVQFRVNGVLLGTATEAPYGVSFGPQQPGLYTVIAMVRDSAGNTTVSAAQVVEVLPNTGPAVELVGPLGTPLDPFVVSNLTSVALVANAADQDGSVTSVTFTVDGVVVGTQFGEVLPGTQRYIQTWEPQISGTVARVFEIKAIATDNLGISTTSTPQFIRVTPRTQDLVPTVSLLNPSTGETLTSSSTVWVVGSAADADGDLRHVEFYVDGILLAKVTREASFSPDSFPFSAKWAVGSAGVFTLVAVAEDNGGNRRMSTPAVVTSVSGSGAPAAKLVAPFRNATLQTSVGGGAVTLVSVLDGGLGYVSAPEVLITGDGTGAQAVANVDPLTGVITGISIVSGGSGYTDAGTTVSVRGGFPLLRLFEDGQRPAVATAIIPPFQFGVPPGISNIVIIDPGSGYRSAPAVVISGTGQDAIARATVGDGQVSGVEIVNAGRGYSQASVSFVGGFDLDPIFLFADVSASAGNTISRVEFFANGQRIGGTSLLPPHRASWFPNGMGNFQLFTVATDDKGNQSVSDLVEVVIGPREGTAPDVSILFPENGSSITPRSTTSFVARASDADGDVERVAFYVDGVFIGNAARQNLSDLWVLLAGVPALEPGEYDLRAVATDDKGNVRHSATLELNVVASEGPVALSPTLSVNPDVLRRGQTALLTVSESGTGVSLESVRFFANGQLVGEAGESPFAAEWTPGTSGDFTLVAVALDANGNQVLSNVATVVVAGNVAPVVEWVNPADALDAYVSTVGQPVFLSVRATDADGSIALVEVILDGVVVGEAERVGLTDRYAFVWEPEQARTGYELRFRAVDDVGLATTSEKRTIDVRLVVGAAPTVVITSPDEDVTVTTNSVLQLFASASGAQGITSVEFFANGGSLGFATPIGGSSFWGLLFPVGVLGPDVYEVVALARDASLNVVGSEPVEVTVVGATHPAASKPLLEVTQEVIRRGESTFLSVSPAGDTALESVQFFANGQSLGEGDEGDDESPLSLSWTPLASGSYQVIAQVTDVFGNTVLSDPLTVEVLVNEPPFAALINPLPGYQSTVGQPVFLEAEARDDHGGFISQVVFIVDGQVLGGEGEDGGVQRVGLSDRYTQTWVPTEERSYNVRVRATDDAGLTVLSGLRTIQVRRIQGSVTPTVSITNPVEELTVTTSSQVQFFALAEAPGGIGSVNFYANGSLIGSGVQVPGSNLWSFPFSFVGLGVDEYSVVALARDTLGNVVGSEPVDLTVIPSQGVAALPPSLEVSSPVIGRGQTSFLTLRTNPDGAALESALFFANGQLIGESESDEDGPSDRFRLAWTPTATGLYQVLATAVDVRGNTVISNIASVEVRAVNGVVPSVSIISPDEDVTLTNLSAWNLAAVASASDGRTVESVQFYLGGELIGSAQRVTASQAAVDQGMPAQLQWILHHSFGSAELGTQDLVAVATDNVGNVTASAPVEITLEGATSAAPSAFTLTVSGGAVVSGERVFTRNQVIQLRAEGSDPDGRIESVTFFRSGILWEEDGESGNPVEEEPFTYSGPVLVSGVYDVYAVATDDTGNTTVSNVVKITSFPPADVFARISSPGNGSVFTVGQFGELETGAQPIQIQVDYRLPVGVAVNDVVLFLNGEELGVEDQLRRRLTQTSLRTEWLADITGELALSAVVIDSRGNTWRTEAVTLTVTPLGVVVPGTSTSFVIQSFFDILDRAPSRSLLNFYTSSLESGQMTRGEVVARLMDHPDFRVKRWVITTYLTALGDFPTVEQLRDGVALLAGAEEGAGGGGAADEGPQVGEEIPANLLTLINDIFESDEFFLRHRESGLLMHPGNFLNLIWETNLGRSWRTFSQRQGQLALIDPELADGGTLLGRDGWIQQLVVGPPADFTTDLVVNNDGTFRIFDNLARRGALILLLLDRDILPGEVDSLSTNIAVAADFVLGGLHNQYAERFDGGVNFFGLQAPSLAPRKGSAGFWLGIFDDRNFDYAMKKGWIDHREHGWMYATGVGFPGGIWMWDHIQSDWLWTRSDRYPFFYSNNEQNWLYYKKGGSPGSRHFFFYRLNGWRTITP